MNATINIINKTKKVFFIEKERKSSVSHILNTEYCIPECNALNLTIMNKVKSASLHLQLQQTVKNETKI